MTPNEIEILNISKGKKKFHYEVETEKENILVTEDIIVEFNLYKGKIITDDDLKKIKKTSKKEELFLRAANYISYQMRSVYEVRMYLKKLDCSQSDIDNILIKLKKLGYIDDELLAKSILDSTINNFRGPKVYLEKLHLKKIKTDLKYLPDLEIECLKKAIEKNKNKNEGKPKLKQKELLISKLLRDGFTSSIVFSLVNEVSFLDNSEELIAQDIEKLEKKYQKLTGYERKKKIISGLLSKGYEYSLITKYLDE